MSYNLDASHCRKQFRKECVCFKVKNTNPGCKDCPTCHDCTKEHSNRPVTGCYYLLDDSENNSCVETVNPNSQVQPKGVTLSN